MFRDQVYGLPGKQQEAASIGVRHADGVVTRDLVHMLQVTEDPYHGISQAFRGRGRVGGGKILILSKSQIEQE